MRRKKIVHIIYWKDFFFWSLEWIIASGCGFISLCTLNLTTKKMSNNKWVVIANRWGDYIIYCYACHLFCFICYPPSRISFFFLQSAMISCHFCCSTQVDYHFSFLFTEFLLLQRGKLRERSRDQDAISHINRTFYAPALCLHIGVVGEGYYIATPPTLHLPPLFHLFTFCLNSVCLFTFIRTKISGFSSCIVSY